MPEIIEENWTKIEKGTWSAQILSDLVAYYLFIEDYENCRKCLEKLKAIDPIISQKGIFFSSFYYRKEVNSVTKSKFWYLADLSLKEQCLIMNSRSLILETDLISDFSTLPQVSWSTNEISLFSIFCPL